MGIETALIGGAVAGGLGGALKGAKGTPDQKQITSTAPAGAQERNLQQQSLDNYLRQQQLAQQSEGRLGMFDPLQQQALQSSQNILSGQAFALTPDEQARINSQRDALVQQGSTDVNRLLDERLKGVVGSAAGRGLRGQALGELQGGVLRSGAEQLGQITNQANLIASQQAMQTPLSRIQAQSGFIGQGLTLPEQLRQQAMSNRETLQSPYLLGLLNNERMRNSTTTNPGQKGSLGQAILGGLGGGIGGLGAGANVGQGISNFNFTNGLNSLYGFGGS